MKKKKRKRKQTDRPIGKIKIVEDFLPKPEDLVQRNQLRKSKEADRQIFSRN